jgi:hypothetical protein
MRTNKKTAARGQVTGRDGYIIAQAIYWFIREQQKLPKEQFEWSNTEDAKLLLLTQFPGADQFFTEADHFAGRKPANLELEKYDLTPPAASDDNVVAPMRGAFSSRGENHVHHVHA